MSKIVSIEQLAKNVQDLKAQGKRVIHCHGTFDLVHPGHLRHFKEARSLGDVLVVTVTAAKFVNKGPGRPVFGDDLRLESLAAIGVIDWVALNNDWDAISLIRLLKPDIYAKGREYLAHESDVTGKISLEVAAVREGGGDVHFTDDIVFSSSSLINSFLRPFDPETKDFLDTLKTQYSIDALHAEVDKMEKLRVLVIGDAIIDEYQYVEPLGQSGKGLHLTARCKEISVFAGGAFAIANHLMGFAGQVTLLTAVGKGDNLATKVVEELLNKRIDTRLIEVEGAKTLRKRRFVVKDGANLSKLFETYSDTFPYLPPAQEIDFQNTIREIIEGYDLVVVCDFADGFISSEARPLISRGARFLALNAQINSGNRGYNVVTHYPKAHYISLNEPELRLTCHDRYADISDLAGRVMATMDANLLACTRGPKGVILFERNKRLSKLPAMAGSVVDRVGAGDAFFALSAAALASDVPTPIAGLIGSAAAGISVQYVGNEESINKVALKKYFTAILK